MERGRDNGNSGGISNIPEDGSEIFQSIYDRNEQRQKAILINLKNAQVAQSQNVRDYWLTKAMEMGEIAQELKDQFPELFGKSEQ